VFFGKEFDGTRVKTSGAEINLIHGGSGNPLLLLHGYPQTHVMWHKVAPRFVNSFHVVCPDLRGYGDSSKPASTEDHYPYSKRAMAQDMVEVMAHLGYQGFFVAGHDRGARVTHRLALDYPEKIKKACVMDIVPTYHMFKTADRHFATGYYHWFFLIQPDGLPEQMIGSNPAYYLTEKLKRWSAPGAEFADDAVAEYVRCFSNPETIHASCEDYRAASSIDLKHDEQDLNKKVRCPLLVLWGAKGFIHRAYDVLGVWRERAEYVEGKALECGHFLPEEAPAAVCEELLRFFGDN
jgi:haloacetate dehalogenase